MSAIESEFETSGWSNLKSGKSAEAISDFSNDLANRLNARSFVGRSQAYSGAKEFVLGICDAKVALELDRSNIKAWYALAKACYGAHRYDQCLAACNNGLLLDAADAKLLQTQEQCHKRINGEPEEPARRHSFDHSHEHSHKHEHEHEHDHEHEHGHSCKAKEHGHAHDDHHDCEAKPHAHVHAHAHDEAAKPPAAAETDVKPHEHAHAHAERAHSPKAGHAHNHDHKESAEHAHEGKECCGGHDHKHAAAAAEGGGAHDHGHSHDH